METWERYSWRRNWLGAVSIGAIRNTTNAGAAEMHAEEVCNHSVIAAVMIVSSGQSRFGGGLEGIVLREELLQALSHAEARISQGISEDAMHSRTSTNCCI